ncbi:4a-hydroxytetrahydrobiopterin dehydratase [Patescibacteria group bacterium]|nr:4a-hydroxytetrahydrobiopterin dehydratase [Patescibacteria group bacterium]
MKWEIINNKLTKEFKFDSFVEAVTFINKIMPLAEKAKHHPDIYLHSYSKVKITLFSHDVGKVTDKDYRLAEEIDAI